MNILSFHHVCIQTECYADSLSFYTEWLGFKLIKETPRFHGREFNTWLKAPGLMIELQTPKTGTRFREWSSLNSGPVHFAVVVASAQHAYEGLKSIGWADFKNKDGKELYQVNGAWLFKVLAPEGTEIEVRDTVTID